MDLDFTAIEARILVDGVCSRVFRNFDDEWCDRGRYGNQAETFQFPDEARAVAFLKSNASYSEV